MSAKSIAKKLKRSALPPLRYYCNVCDKQCRDQNGYDDHCNNNKAHKRRVEDQESCKNIVTERNSQLFEAGFIDILKRRYQVSVLANRVYNEYIQDRSHIHLSSTFWSCLTKFVLHLRDSHVCAVHETDQGFWVRYLPPSTPS